MSNYFFSIYSIIPGIALTKPKTMIKIDSAIDDSGDISANASKNINAAWPVPIPDIDIGKRLTKLTRGIVTAMNQKGISSSNAFARRCATRMLMNHITSV